MLGPDFGLLFRAGRAARGGRAPSSSWRVAAHAALVLLLLTITAPLARAQAKPVTPGALHVLTLDAEDGTDDQAEALSAALRSRLRNTPGWSVADTTMSLGMLTAALKCSSRPDPGCQQKIGDQLKADRYVWGFTSKGKGQVTAEVHLWNRGRPDLVVKESFADNLRDQNDETVRRIAARMLDRLTGNVSPGVIVVHAGEGGGVVLLDGTQRGQLENGSVAIDVKPGTYIVEVRVDGWQPAKQTVSVTTGVEAPVTFHLVVAEGGRRPPVEPPHNDKSGGVTGRQVLAFSLLGVGAVGGVLGVVSAAQWSSAKSDADTHRNYPGTANCGSPAPGDETQVCKNNDDAKKWSTIGLVAGGVGAVALGTGIYLLVTAPPKGEAKVGALRPRVTPAIGPRYSGLDLQMAF